MGTKHSWGGAGSVQKRGWWLVGGTGKFLVPWGPTPLEGGGHCLILNFNSYTWLKLNIYFIKKKAKRESYNPSCHG